ncbi:MAG: YebC/PmpR family DNA-binding transcriptional regulator [Panacagrimonas sp.]|jgi:YebC/PmpR family DNA-binding regulatory protein|nr:YebC/PmpR family DNA-binding transcriptional regulator [Panacagrimonas sp.]MCC2655131.1 YebC/PmpR family DNA-binding transcriptional regulator [Panacagrimonas sp.]
MGRGPSIEGRKGVADAQKAKVFTKLIREITLAVKQGGPDPTGNSRLRLAVGRALSANMTRDRVEAAIKRSSGEGADASIEVRYEGYAPGGVAVLVDCVTDNPTRTVADVRHAFSKSNGHMGTSGSVAFQFAQVGQLWFELDDPAVEDRILEVALDAGADDVQGADGWCEVLSTPAAFEQVQKALVDAGFKPSQARVTMRPSNPVAVSGDAAADVRKLLEKLEELDDVQDVFHNAELT